MYYSGAKKARWIISARKVFQNMLVGVLTRMSVLHNNIARGMLHTGRAENVSYKELFSTLIPQHHNQSMAAPTIELPLS